MRLTALLVICTRGALGQCDETCTGCTSCSDCYAQEPCYWFPNNPSGQKCQADSSGGGCDDNCVSSDCPSCTDQTHCTRVGGCSWNTLGTPQCSAPTPAPTASPTCDTPGGSPHGLVSCCQTCPESHPYCEWSCFYSPPGCTGKCASAKCTCGGEPGCYSYTTVSCPAPGPTPPPAPQHRLHAAEGVYRRPCHRHVHQSRQR